MKTNDQYGFCLFKIPSEGGRLIWEITNRCNYSCKYCIFSSGKVDTSEELTTEQILSALIEIKEYGIRHLKITGGEPFMRKDMPEIITKVSELGLKMDISTNASLLNDKSIEALKDPNIEYVHVSLDGSDQYMQELVRGKHTFDLTIRGIRKLTTAGIYTRIGTVIHKGNENHLKEIIEYVISLGANEIIFSLMEPVGRMKGDDSLVTTKDADYLEKKLNLLKLKYKDKIKVNHAFTKKKDEKCSSATCPGGKKFLFLNNVGQLSPCTWISEYFPEYVSKESLKTRSFKELVNGKEMKEYFELLVEQDVKGQSGCPKSYLKEIKDRKEITKLFEGDFDINMKEQIRFSRFSTVYSFTTENLAGYLPKLDFQDAKVLTVTASGDHAINAFFFGAKEVTCFDSNLLSRYLTILKIEAMKELSYTEFLDFFMRDGKDALSLRTFNRFREKLPDDVEFFFHKAFLAFGLNGKKLRESSLFNNLHDSRQKKISYNPYLKNKKNYDLAKKRLENMNISFLDESIEAICEERRLADDFDIILLSNIADYSHLMYPGNDYLDEFKKNIIDYLNSKLSPEGKLIFAYIYDSGKKDIRNLIDSPKARKETFDCPGYEEMNFLSAMGGRKKDTIAMTSKRIINSLVENSESYFEKADIYDRFSEVEDSPGKILKFLEETVKDKVVLDFGCGTGKYLKELSPSIKSGIGVDVSDKEIMIAGRKCKNLKNISFQCTSAENIDLPDESVDIAYGTWCIGSIIDPDKRQRIINELRRVVKKGGTIYLIENDEVGEFEELRGKIQNPEKPTKKLNGHIMSMGFRKFKSIKTNFEFSDMTEARYVFGNIWGDKVAEKISSEKVEHDVLILTYAKDRCN